MVAENMRPVHLGGAKVGRSRHICAFFRSQDEEFDVMLPFIKEGMARGEKAVHIVDPRLRGTHIQRLENAGLDAGELQSRKQLEIRNWEQTYLRSGGCFDQDDMLSLIQDVLRDGKREGFPLTRLIAHMEWSCAGRPGVENLIEYEARLNDVLPQFDDPVICVYDLSQFSAGTMIDILRVHPQVIIGGMLHENPFYAPPEEFLSELKARRA